MNQMSGIKPEPERDRVKGDVLLVDDMPDNLHLLSTILKQQGYKVRVARQGSTALTAAQVVPPDLILLDINLPGMDGYEVCKELKSQPKTQEIPVIFISASTEGLDKLQAFSVGGVDYITKPFQLEEVLARIEHQLTILRLQQKLKQQNQQLRAANALLQAEILERKRIEASLQAANRELERLATLDGLTQVANRRYFNDYLTQVWQQGIDHQDPVCLILGDIDHFKAFNDTYGHLVGDDCLRQVAKGIEQVVGNHEALTARYGGEEFAVILPHSRLEQGLELAAGIQARIETLAIAHAGSSVSPYLSLSIGVASLIPSCDRSPDLLIHLSDQALYQAKQQGRNQIVGQTMDLLSSSESDSSAHS